jgi:hypothetical protein
MWNKYKHCTCRHVKEVKQSHYRPWQALRVTEGLGSQILRQSAHEGGTVVSPAHWLPWPPGNIPGALSVRGWVDPRAIVQPEGLYQWKISMTRLGIDPVTFQFVAQCLKHCATACPTCLQVQLQKFICKCMQTATLRTIFTYVTWTSHYIYHTVLSGVSHNCSRFCNILPMDMGALLHFISILMLSLGPQLTAKIGCQLSVLSMQCQKARRVALVVGEGERGTTCY